MGVDYFIIKRKTRKNAISGVESKELKEKEGGENVGLPGWR